MGFFGEKISAFRASDQSLSLSIWSLLRISDFCLFLSVDEQKTRAQVTTIRERSEIKKKTWWTTKNLIEIEKKKFGLIIRFSRLLLLFRLNSFSNKNGGFSKVLLRVDVRRSSVEPAASEQHLHQQQAWQPPQHRFRQLREDVGPKNLFRRKNIVLHQRVRRSHDALLKVLLFYGKNLKEL